MTKHSNLRKKLQIQHTKDLIYQYTPDTISRFTDYNFWNSVIPNSIFRGYYAASVSEINGVNLKGSSYGNSFYFNTDYDDIVYSNDQLTHRIEDLNISDCAGLLFNQDLTAGIYINFIKSLKIEGSYFSILCLRYALNSDLKAISNNRILFRLLQGYPCKKLR